MAPEQVKDFGPLYQIWAFGGERLYLNLKHTNTNRHGNGEEEKSYLTFYQRYQDALVQVRLHATSTFCAATVNGASSLFA